MIHLDTSFLIHAMISGSAAESKLLEWIKLGEKIGVSSIAWSEFLCGPLTEADRLLAKLLIEPPETFLAEDAERAADLFNQTGRRSRSLADCQIAAIAIRRKALLATNNEPDFKPIMPHGLQLA